MVDREKDNLYHEIEITDENSAGRYAEYIFTIEYFVTNAKSRQYRLEACDPTPVLSGITVYQTFKTSESPRQVNQLAFWN
jgi:hypothetical protein